jgi:hypothetical protein
MNELDSFDSESSDTVFRDVILLALCGFVAVVLILLPHLHPPLEAKEAPPPGNVVVEINWPSKIDADVDLWVEAPGDQPVGYSNKGGKVFNLLRDDLGQFRDLTDVNYEVAYSRGVVEGEYTINIHLYRNKSAILPVPVTVVASVKRTNAANLKRLTSAKIELAYTGEEVTVVRFSLNKTGEIVPGSMHRLHKPLRSRR